MTPPDKSCILFPLGFPLIIKNPTLSTFISAEGALYVILPYDYPAAAAAPTF